LPVIPGEPVAFFSRLKKIGGVEVDPVLKAPDENYQKKS